MNPNQSMFNSEITPNALIAMPNAQAISIYVLGLVSKISLTKLFKGIYFESTSKTEYIY